MDEANTATFDTEDSATVLHRCFFIVISRGFYSCDFFCRKYRVVVRGKQGAPLRGRQRDSFRIYYDDRRTPPFPYFARY